MADRIKYLSTSYLGQKAFRREVRKAGPQGERVILTHWVDAAIGQPIEHPAGTTTLRRITGTERRGTLVILEEDHVVELADWMKSDAEFFTA